MNRLPVDLVFVTKTRTGAGGKAAVLQALLGDRNIARSVLLDDNWQVCSEIERVGGIPLNIKAIAKGALVESYSLEQRSTSNPEHVFC